MKVKELISLLEEDGWVLVRVRGSQRQYQHPTKRRTVTIAGKLSVDVTVGTCISTLKQARLKSELKMKFVVVLEEGPTSFGAHAPDLPGCFAVGETRDEVLRLIQEAIALQIEGMREAGEVIPEHSSTLEIVEVTA